MVGGTENSVKLLAEGLLKKGHDVAVYCIDTNEKKSIQYINGVKVYRFKAGLFDINYRNGNKNGKTKKIINKIIELRNVSIKHNFEFIVNDFKPNVIHTNNLFGISPYVWNLIHKKNIKLVHTLRDYWLLSPNISYDKNDNGKFTEMYRSYFKKYSNKVDIVTAPSEFTLNVFKELGYFKNSQFYHISNSMELDLDYTNELIYKKYEIIDKNVKFIFVGDLSEKKGIDKLLEVFCKNKNNNITLTVCGKGKLKEYVIGKSNEDKRIIYKGQLNREKLDKELIKSDVLIIPSMWEEPFGRVVIEANKFGLPVIGSSKGGIKEILLHTKSGELFKDINELENLIVYFSIRSNIKKYYESIRNNISIYSLEHQLNYFCKVYMC